MNTETTFENAKIGDRVFAIPFGWGKVIDVNKSYTFPITVLFENYQVFSYLYNGCECVYNNQGFILHPPMQVLFWDEVKIVIPSNPKNEADL